MRILFFLLITCCSFALSAANDSFYTTQNFILESFQKIEITAGFKFTSVSIGIPKDNSFATMRMFINGVQEPLTPDPHFENDSQRFSNLIILSNPCEQYTLVNGKDKQQLTVYLHYAPTIRVSLPVTSPPAACVKPTDISQTVWRQGLPDPKGTRTLTNVRHLVVHHSAGSNSDTDYLNTVRNIYLYHINQNGYDDIAYNYLIAPDGTIFKGRDPQGVGDEDNIHGAHFCAKNSGTMGVCMLGNFNLKKVPEPGLNMLIELLTWKCAKENFLPDEMEVHPTGSGILQKHVIGHRDGCATECPGDSLYMVMSDLRNTIRQRLLICAPTTQIVQPLHNITVYPNPFFTENLIINKLSGTCEIKIFSPSGRLVYSCHSVESEQITISTGDFLPGIYLMRITGTVNANLKIVKSL